MQHLKIMTRKEQVKILNDKIEANNAQYNLDRMNAEISAYSSGDLHKYKYLTKKDLNYKPNAFEQAKYTKYTNTIDAIKIYIKK